MKEVVFEVEVKVRVLLSKEPVEQENTFDALCRRLLEFGAVEIGTKVQTDRYLSHPCRDLASSDESIRIRSESKGPSGSLRVTYKGPKVSDLSKTRKEIELSFVPGTSIDDAMDLFMSLGFGEVMTIVKRRRSFEMEGTTLCADLVEGLGVFLEAERMSSSIAEAEAKVIALLDSLEYKDRERRSYLELLMEG